MRMKTLWSFENGNKAWKAVQWKMESVVWNMKEMKELQEGGNRHFGKMEMWKWKMNENIWKGREYMEIGMETIE